MILLVEFDVFEVRKDICNIKVEKVLHLGYIITVAMRHTRYNLINVTKVIRLSTKLAI